jgi:hypothetical protein
MIEYEGSNPMQSVVKQRTGCLLNWSSGLGIEQLSGRADPPTSPHTGSQSTYNYFQFVKATSTSSFNDL